jgi:cell division protein ZapA (FtsZ GTPase activity inhibitor)
MKRAAVKLEAKREAKQEQLPVASEDTSSEAPPETGRRPVAIKLAGKEYRIRSGASAESLQQVADYVDQSMQKVRERTDTVDSVDTALLTALNLAREVLYLRDQAAAPQDGKGESNPNPRDHSDARLRGLIEQVEAALPAAEPGLL